jgi:hypothetical protein
MLLNGEDNELTPKQAEALAIAMNKDPVKVKARELKSRYECACGGKFEMVEANLTYSERYLQCDTCDSTKIVS